jgi:hypothetical protein
MKRSVLLETTLFHPLLKKKKEKWCYFERHCTSPSSPGCAQAGEEGDFLPYNTSLPLFPKTPNKPTRLTPHLVPRQGKKEIFSPTTHLSLSLLKP